jgi:Dyp-type peroxidase family
VTALELSDIQGDILRAYGNAYDCTSYVFVRIDDAAAGRAWLADATAHVTTAAPWTAGKPETTLNIALTAAGLAALGVPADVLETFSHEFRQGMAARAKVLGDSGLSAPSAWEAAFGTRESHVLLVVNAQEREHADRALAKLRAAVDAADGVQIVHEEQAALLEGAREHFGFADGFAQPAIAGATDDKAAGGGIPEKDGGWRALAPGEFILGYPDEDTLADARSRLPAAPAAPLGRNGTYMVWRKLHQDVALWRRTIRAAASRYPGGEVALAAKVVGRWPDGAPLETHPDAAPGADFDPAAPGANDFRYAGDLDGRRCPLGAHIRRSNPRDALDPDAKLSMRHRMIRRGMPYGPPLPDGELDDDGSERGLIFVSFQASIARQFEGVQGPWLSDGNIFGLGHDKDYLLGDPDGGGKMTIQGERPFFLAPQKPLVTTRGGEYLFVPGIAALRAIAAGTIVEHGARSRTEPERLGGPDRVVKVLGAMERHMNNVPGFKRGHARGVAFRGEFRATPEVAALTTAEHLQGDPVATVVRLSNGGSSPYMADRAGPKRGNPLGLGVRFELPSGGVTTWTALSLPAFPPTTPDDFHAMVSAQRAELPGGLPNPLRLAAFILPRPRALAGIKAAATLAPPASFATARFNGFHAYYLVDAEGRRRAFRFRWMPAAGIANMDPADDKLLPPQYLVNEIKQRVADGPVSWRLVFQLAAPDDPVDDLTRLWPEDRKLVDAGELVIDRLHEDPALVDTYVFDPTQMPPGIELSGDPLLHFRSEAYAESHRRRSSESRPAILPE